MNGQERFLRAIRCEEIDQLPSFGWGMEPAGLFRKEYDAFWRRNWWKRGKSSWFTRGTSSVGWIGASQISFPAVYYNPEKDTFYTKNEAAALPEAKKKYEVNMYGQVLQRGYVLGKEGERDSKYWWFHKHLFSGPDALEKMDAFYNEFGKPWEQEFNPDNNSIKRNKTALKIHEKRGFPSAILAGVPMHFEGIWGGFGPTTIANLVRKKPNVLKDICQKFEKYSLIEEQCNLEAGVKILRTGDDLGQKDRTLIAPKIYEEFFLPALKSRSQLAHKYDAVMFMHSCGFVEELLDHFLEAKLDGLQSLEVPAGNDLNRIRAKIRDKMALIGGIDSSRIMTFGTPAECDAHVKVQIKKATTLDGTTMNGGYIPGPAHELLDTPMANVDATIQAIAKYGKYPLNL